MEEIATVYSQALLEVGIAHERLDELHEQLGQLADAIDADRNLQVFFFSPYFSTAEKQDGLGRMVSDADPLLTNFMGLLIEKHRMPLIFRIRREFDQRWEEHNRMLAVSVTSAIALDQLTVTQIGDRIGERTGRRVSVTSVVDPDIIGGIVLRVGNSILDASIRNRLEQLRKQVARG
jgi:F-type H+-transporting ATPase subunit delta